MPDSPSPASEPVAAAYARIMATIRQAAERAGRDPRSVQIVAVTKTVKVDLIREAQALGLNRFGENRVQEAIPKIQAIGPGCEWHLIGHLQTNKVRLIAGNFSMIQSIDSERLVEALDARLADPLDVLIEVNVAEEPQKTGALPDAVVALAKRVAGSRHLRLRGLMTVARLGLSPEAARPSFRDLWLLRERLKESLGSTLPELSMGMTEDYSVAIEEGATMLRLGRAIFGAR